MRRGGLAGAALVALAMVAGCDCGAPDLLSSDENARCGHSARQVTMTWTVENAHPEPAVWFLAAGAARWRFDIGPTATSTAYIECNEGDRVCQSWSPLQGAPETWTPQAQQTAGCYPCGGPAVSLRF